MLAKRVWMFASRLRWKLFTGGKITVISHRSDVRPTYEELAFYGIEKSSRIEFIPSLNLRSALSSAVTFIWDLPGIPSRWLRRLPGVFWVDPRRNPTAAWELCNVAEMRIARPSSAECSRRVCKAFASLRELRLGTAYVFGTGPSLAMANEFDWSNGYRIVCNTIVRDGSLWEHLMPHVLVAADGLYHFSHTRHAMAFREDAIMRMREHPAWFIYPERFDPIVRREFTGLADWLVPLPQGPHSKFYVPVDQAHALPAGVGNILGSLLLPVACSLSRDVRLLGFDGRAPNDRLFWKNSGRHSYPELIDELSQKFPAFFEANVPKTDPEKYVRRFHGNRLNLDLREAEKRGFKFRLLSPSFTETLQSRLDVSGLPKRLAQQCD